MAIVPRCIGRAVSRFLAVSIVLAAATPALAQGDDGQANGGQANGGQANDGQANGGQANGGQDDPKEAAVPAVVGFLSLGDEATPTELAVSPGSELIFPFTVQLPPKASEEPIQIYVTPFRGQQRGGYINPAPSILELPDLEAADQRIAVPVGQPVMSLRLTLPDFQAGDTYSGQIVVMQKDAVVKTAALSLATTQAEQKVELAVDRSAISATDSLWPGYFGESLRFTVPVRNASDEWQAEGVYLRVLEVTSPDGAGLDPEHNLKLAWNGTDDGDLLRSPGDEPGSARRSIAPGKQATISGSVRDLPAGEYTIKLAISAANAKAESHPEVTITLRVRHSVIWALLVLLAAIVISFTATKGLDAQRKRVAVLKQVSELRPPWLREGPSTLPVVAVRAVLRQAETRYRLWWNALFAPGAVSDRLTKASEMLKLIRRTRAIRQAIARWNQDMMIRNRAEKRLNGIVANLDLETIDEKTTAAIGTRLTELESWLSSDKLYALYWVDLKNDLDKLRARVKPEDFPEGDARVVVADLIKAIDAQVEALAKTVQAEGEAAKTPQDLSAYLDVEENYAKLKVLCERLTEEDSEALAALVARLKEDPKCSIHEFFRLADDFAWEGIQGACSAGAAGMEFTEPRRGSIQPPGAFQLVRFEVAPKDRRLGRNYLFKHGLEFRWTLELLTPKRKASGQDRQLLTEETTRAPRLIQYVPQQGDLYVTVKMRREGHAAAEPVSFEKPLQIAASNESSWTSAFRAAEVMAFGIAAVFAVVSGLGTYYFVEATFGSPQDYITLFIWGAGVDQAKNFIQNLERAQPADS